MKHQRRSLVLIVWIPQLLIVAAVAAEKSLPETSLSARYPYVARDMLRLCEPEDGFWVDLGAGSGGVALALLAERDNPVVMLDPDSEALQNGLENARELGKSNRLSAVVGVAENLPFPNDSVDWLVSRGSIFFWDDPAQGLEEVYRVLRPGAQAMIGGGAGSGFPAEAVEQLIADRKEESQGDEAERWQKFIELRRPEQMQAWAEAAKLPEFRIMGKGAVEGGDPEVGQGIWVVLKKQPEVVTKKAADKIEVRSEQAKRIYTISSPSGIGGATITRSGPWPAPLVLRLRLRGLESLTVQVGDIHWSASVLSHSGHQRLISVKQVDEKLLSSNDPLWADVTVMDAQGQPAEGLPQDGGYFELALPIDLLKDQPRTIQLQWIDFYR